jgi:hypothetical protein
MTDHARDVDATSHESSADSPSEVVSLRPLLLLLAKYRNVIALSVVGAMALCGAGLLAIAALMPTEHTGSLQFRLLFDGASEGRYPNGTSFSPAEIVATPVLNEVFRVNDLQRYGSYQDFKDSMAVLRSSVAIDMLAAAYSARLADTRLTGVDRARIEDEFRKKREALIDPVYTVTIRRSERLSAMPTALMEKVLNDTVQIWARQTDEVKGVTRFDVPVFSPGILKPDLLEQDYLMAADGLRVQARRAAGLAARLMQLPGASSIRSEKDRTSLSDVSYDIADTLRNRIEPLIFLIQERGLATQPQVMAKYLEGRVTDLRLERDATNARIAALQDALQGYMSNSARSRETPGQAGNRPAQPLEGQTVIPQMSDSFLDRIIEMSTQTQAADVEYRKKLTDRIIREGEALFELNQSAAYYDALERGFRPAARSVTAGEDDVRAQLRLAYDALVLAINRLMVLYDELSAQRLNPATMLYAVSDPFSSRTTRALTSRTVVFSLALAAVLALFVAPIGCAIHQSIDRDRRRMRRLA